MRPVRHGERHLCAAISIHAPLAGCDRVESAGRFYHRNFNPRTPCGVRPFFRGMKSTASLFQSTHPLRGATGRCLFLFRRLRISIHAPLAGCDLLDALAAALPDKFQSTHPLRGATSGYVLVEHDGKISIHAPLAGCDDVHIKCSKEGNYFNPRTPCGVRP